MSDNTSESSENTQPSSAADPGRRNFLKYVIGGAIGAGVASAAEIPVLGNLIAEENQKLQEANTRIDELNSEVNQQQSAISNLQAQLSDIQNQSAGYQGIVALNIDEQILLEAIVETIIPTDENGPGAKEAGVIYFIDKQLSGDYGKNANMYTKAPFVLSGQSGSITVDGITYQQGSPTVPYQGPMYQYNLQLREFWRFGLEALQNYSNQTYGNNFQDLDENLRIQVLTDIYENKPQNFNDIVPRDFFGELIFMTWSGFFMDPLYGGNINMVGWKLTGFNGTNMGLHGGGINVLDVTDLMVDDKPTRLEPFNLGQFQKSLNLIGGGNQNQ